MWGAGEVGIPYVVMLADFRCPVQHATDGHFRTSVAVAFGGKRDLVETGSADCQASRVLRGSPEVVSIPNLGVGGKLGPCAEDSVLRGARVVRVRLGG